MTTRSIDMTRMGAKSNFRRFLSYVAPYKHYLILAILGGIVKFTVPLLIPQLTRHLVDNVFLNPAIETSEQIRELLFYTGGLALIFVFVWAPFTYARSYFAGKAGQRSIFDLRCDLYDRILRMSASFFGRNKSGGIVARLISDVELIKNLVGSALTNIWMDFAAIFVILYFLLRIDPLVSLVALITFPVYLYFFKKFQKEIRASTHQVQEEIGSMAGNAQEKIAGSKVVHAFTGEKREEESFQRDAEQLFSTSMRRIHFRSTNSSVSGLITQLAPLIVIFYGGYAVITGRLTIGELMAVTLYLAPLYRPLERLSELNVVIANSMAALDRVFQIMDEKPEIADRPGAKPLERVRGRVEFERVHFSYVGEDDQPILEEMSFEVEPGQKVALVGPSGSGKSTLVSLIPRFHDPDSGVVRVDGYDVRDLKVRSLRRHIGMVLQDPVLFSGTVRENILYGKPTASDEEVTAACKAANAFDFIRALPHGLDSEVGEGGNFLSGGQKQRVTIARAFLKDPKILILDEATSSLDSESERLIQAALERLMENRTTFIIAHRLSTIVNADRILVLERGRIVDSGTHQQLLGRRGVYQDLYRQVAV